MDWWQLQGLDEGKFITLLFHVMLAYTWDLNRSIYPPFKDMCLTKWSRLYKPFLTFVTSFSVMYMAQSLNALEDALDHFHHHHKIFRMSGTRLDGFNLPQSHAAVHYLCLIQAFGTPNGLFSSITESKHIQAVKEPWRWSSCWNTLKQMLTTNSRLNKLAAAQADFASHGMLEGTILESILSQLGKSRSRQHSVLKYDHSRFDLQVSNHLVMNPLLHKLHQP